MNIPIQQTIEDTLPTLVASELDGECLHNGELVVELVDFGFADTIQNDWVEDMQECYVCARCGTTIAPIEVELRRNRN